MIEIQSLATLEIQAGVSVIFTSLEAGIDVYGALLTRGIEGVHVTFSSKSPILTKMGLWNRIRRRLGGSITLTHTIVRQASVGVQGDGLGVRLDHSLIYGCYSGIKLSGGIEEKLIYDQNISSPIVSNSRSVLNNYGIILHGIQERPFISIENSEFSLNEYHGLVIENWDQTDTAISKLSLLHCKLENNKRSGLSLLSKQPLSVSIDKSSLSRNGRYGIILDTSYTDFALQVDVFNSEVMFNKYSGIHLRYHCWDCTYKMRQFLRNNVIVGNGRFQVYLYFSSYVNRANPFLFLEVSNNTVSDHSYSLGYSLYLKAEHVKSFVNLTGNTLKEVRGGVHVNGNPQTPFMVFAENNLFERVYDTDRSALLTLNSILNMTNNTFSDNTVSDVVYLQTGLNHTMSHNRFINNTRATCLLKIGETFDNEKFVTASHNYWGTTNVQLAKSKICDVFMDFTKGRVLTDVMYLTPEMTSPNDVSATDLFRRHFDSQTGTTIVGGIVESDLMLSFKDKEQIIINRTIIINFTSRCSIFGGNLITRPKRGFILLGPLSLGNGTITTILQGDINGGKSNCIHILNADLRIENTYLSDYNTFLVVKGGSSTVSLENSMLLQTERLMEIHNERAEFTFFIKNTSISTISDLADINIHQKGYITISILDSRLSSKNGYLFQISELEVPTGLGNVNFELDDTMSESVGSDMFNFELCSTKISCSLRQSLFRNDGNGGTIVKMKAHVEKIEVLNSSFTGGEKAMSFENCKIENQAANTHGELTIDSNIFENTSTTALEIHGNFVTIDILNNFFDNNWKCINISVTKGFDGIVISGNELIKNKGNGIISLVQSNYITSSVELIHNVFLDNNGTMVMINSPHTHIYRNVFENKFAAYNIRVIPGSEDNSGLMVNASLNYWGTTDVKDIEKKIFDYNFDNTLLDVNYRPYLGSRNFTDIRNESAEFILSSGEIGGIVDKDIKLLKTDSPYFVVSNIVVPEKSSLTIEAGVEVLFQEDLGILVHGILISNGLDDNVVEMRPENYMKRWKGIDIRSKEAGIKSVIRYTVVRGTTNGIRLRSSNTDMYNVTSTSSSSDGITIIVNGTLPENVYTELTVSNNAGNGLRIMTDQGFVRSASILIDTCNAEQNLNGIYVTAAAIVKFLNCRIIGNKDHGTYLHQQYKGEVEWHSSLFSHNVHYAMKVLGSRRIILESSSIINHDYRLYGKYIFQSNPHIYFERTKDVDLEIRITNNQFTNNRDYGIKIALLWNSKGNLKVNVENNTFTSSYNLLYVMSNHYTYYENMAFISFNNNTIVHNTIVQGNLVDLDVEYVGKLQIIDNRFRGNNAGNMITFSSYYIRRSLRDIVIENNVFIDNYASHSLIDVRKFHSLRIQNNVLTNNDLTACILKAPDFTIDHSEYEILSTQNYWGSDKCNEIVERVCGFEKDMSKSFIRYIPYYIDMHLQQLENSTNEDFEVANAYGGKISKNITLHLKSIGNATIISRSLFIRRGVTLTLMGAITLNFKKKRGIYIAGSLKTNDEGDVFDEDSYTTLTTSKAHESLWYGVLLNSNEFTSLLRLRMSNTEKGFVAYTPQFEIKHSRLYNSKASCVAIRTSSNTDITYNFVGTIIDGCYRYGIVFTGSGNAIVQNVYINNVATGISMNEQQGNLLITDSNFTNCKTSVYSKLGFFGGYLQVSRCRFINCTNGVDFKTNTWRVNTADISKNVFVNIKDDALHIEFPSNNHNTNKYVGQLSIGSNVFTNTCHIFIQTWNNASLSFYENTIQNAFCRQPNSCLLDLLSEGKATHVGRRIDFSTNIFKEIDSECVVNVFTSDKIGELNGAFYYNHFLSTQSYLATVLLESEHFDLSHNIFDNPQTSFDIYVKKKAQGSINASNNWWGSSNYGYAYNRIYDNHYDSSLLFVNITPVLTDNNIDCSGVNNCSNRGQCISPNRCRCKSGWTGEICADYDCSDVKNCYGNGECAGPNSCNCSVGWSGKQCTLALCSDVNNCSGNGICVRPNVCVCGERFEGDDCGSCTPLHWGEDCQPCLKCLNGDCNGKTGVCDCYNEQWTGDLCDQCSDTFYGPDCLPLMMVLNVIPNQGLDKGGNNVHVWGHNFPNTSNSYKCKFGDMIMEGEWLAWNHVVCIAPEHSGGVVELEISADGTTFTHNERQYQFYATCPASSCGRDKSPPRGQCLFGGCTCNLPWTGSNCSIELIAPFMESLIDLIVNETVLFIYQLELIQGTNPVTWNIENGPDGVTLDERTGLLKWQNIVARPSAYDIKILVTNIVGRQIINLNIKVLKTYTVILTNIEPSGILPSPTDVSINGIVDFGDILASPVPVMIKIISLTSGNIRTLSIRTDENNPTEFKTTYYPRPDDAGKFSVEAYHPGFDQEHPTNFSWIIKAMECEPNFVLWREYIDSDTLVFRNITTLLNTANYPLQNISAKVYGLENVIIRMSVKDQNDTNLVHNFNGKDKLYVDMYMSRASPMRGTFYVVFRTPEKTSARLQIDVSLSIRKPVLEFNPKTISTNVLRGKQKIIDVSIRNIGDVSARNVQIELPSDDKISLASFSTPATILFGSLHDGLLINPNETALLSIAYTISPEAQLGELGGVIVVRTNLTVFILPYRVTITSDDTLNMTFIVKDEYTYFANGAPLVGGAEVRLVNPTRRYFNTRISKNNTGTVVFENIFEDRYTLHAKADGHSSYSAVILLSPDITKMEIFLPRTAVKYTWTVTPTTVQDKYKITLDSTFETFVPMPVVTIEPARLDTTPFELEEQETVEFTIKNHGLIRADNLRFSMPTGHPSLKFTSMVDTIGDLAANTSIVVPVIISPKTRTKWSGGCGMALLYSYECGGTRTKSAGVVLEGSCGNGNIFFNGQGSGGGSGGGWSIAHRSETPVPCDCATELLKSCFLAYIPVVGCITSSVNLAGSSGPELPAAIIDIAMSCVVGELCSVCGLAYTTLMCLKTIEDKCGNRRQKRDISSEVVENVLFSAKPLQNYIDMMEEIFADQRMFEEKRDWHQAFKTVISDSSEYNQYLSSDEMSFVFSTLPRNSSALIIQRFLYRWNNTVTAWDSGNLNEEVDAGNAMNIDKLAVLTTQYIHDTDIAKQRGFDSIFDDFDHAMRTYRTAEIEEQTEGKSKRDGAICAKVRVRILQELVLTREAFKARLEIENGETAPLENILVQINIREAEGTGEPANYKFSIGKPDLLGISGVSGNGRLGKDLSGSAQWLIIPYSNAAPYDDTLYLVGGRLSYSIGESNFSVPLTPDIITVKPNPSLVLHYFHEKYIQGDDPLTEEKEPIVPFSLAVMVTNTGNGIARGLKISSAQPEIIENEKGLLVSFQIISAYLGNFQMQPSLTVNLGDIATNETKTARWLLTSSLLGTFYNFSATFENINPLGDPQLSLFESVQYHELIHLVRIFTDGDDGIDDFLVNQFVDNNGIPERLYNSANESDVNTVCQATILSVSSNLGRLTEQNKFQVITLTVKTNSSSWFYVRLNNNYTTRDLDLLTTKRSTGKYDDINVGKNVWLTTHIQDLFLIHLLDYHEASSGVIEEITISYNLTFGTRNTNPPKLDGSLCIKTIPKHIAIKTPLCTIGSVDLDSDKITFKLIPESLMFEIDVHTGVIRTKMSPLPTGVFRIIVAGTDDGIPHLSQYVNITLNVTSGDEATFSTATMTSITTVDAGTANLNTFPPTPDSTNVDASTTDLDALSPTPDTTIGDTRTTDFKTSSTMPGTTNALIFNLTTTKSSTIFQTPMMSTVQVDNSNTNDTTVPSSATENIASTRMITAISLLYSIALYCNTFL